MVAKAYKSILSGVDMIQFPYAPHTLASADDFVYIYHSLCCYFLEMFLIGDLCVAGPLIFPVKQFYQPLGKYFLKIP